MACSTGGCRTTNSWRANCRWRTSRSSAGPGGTNATRSTSPILRTCNAGMKRCLRGRACSADSLRSSIEVAARMTQDIARTLAAAQQKFVGGQLDEAAALLNGVLATQPDHGEALEGLGYIAAKSGDYTRAADLVTRALQVMPASRDQIYWAAEVCQLADRHDEAAALFERCLAQGPDHPPYLHGAAV